MSSPVSATRLSIADLLTRPTDESLKLAVWAKGHPIANFDKAVWRRDDFGYLIRYSDYGNRSSEYGWEKDHIHPTALGGLDYLGNLRPLHCRNNAGLGGLLGGLMNR